MRDGFLVPSEIVEKNPALAQGVMMLRIELECVFEARQGLIEARELREDVAALTPQAGVVRPKLDRLVEDVERLLEAPVLLQCRSEACKIFGLGRSTDRADDPLQGVIVVLVVEKQQAHQMLGVRVLRIDREGLLAASTRVEMPSGPEMLKARFAISGWCFHRWHVVGCH